MRNEKSMFAAPCQVEVWPKPTNRNRLVSSTLYWNEPSPDAIDCCDAAPASSANGSPPVLVITVPVTVVLTWLTQVTGPGALDVLTFAALIDELLSIIDVVIRSG